MTAVCTTPVPSVVVTQSAANTVQAVVDSPCSTASGNNGLYERPINSEPGNSSTTST